MDLISLKFVQKRTWFYSDPSSALPPSPLPSRICLLPESVNLSQLASVFRAIFHLPKITKKNCFHTGILLTTITGVSLKSGLQENNNYHDDQEQNQYNRHQVTIIKIIFVNCKNHLLFANLLLWIEYAVHMFLSSAPKSFKLLLSHLNGRLHDYRCHHRCHRHQRQHHNHHHHYLQHSNYSSKLPLSHLTGHQTFLLLIR